MGDWCNGGWTNVTVSSLVTSGPAVLDSVVYLSANSAGDATIYAGRDAGSGRKVCRLAGTATPPVQQSFCPALYCESGIYVAITAGTVEVLVCWRPYVASSLTAL